MAGRTMVLDDLKQRTLEEVLRQVASQQEALTVRLPEGQTVSIQPTPLLKPLPVLEGFVPEGWKDALYDGSGRGSAGCRHPPRLHLRCQGLAGT
jgi:hypothetical protein